MSETNSPLLHTCTEHLSTGGACLICGRQVKFYDDSYQRHVVEADKCPGCGWKERAEAAEARATAAEQERDTLRLNEVAYKATFRADVQQIEALSCKLAVAEQREAELQLMLDIDSTARFDSRTKAALASPSTPSPK